MPLSDSGACWHFLYPRREIGEAPEKGGAMSPEILRELQQLLSALCDGELTDAQRARLEELLNSDAECRRRYLEYVDMHARLLVHPHHSGGITLPPGEGRSDVSAGEPVPEREAYLPLLDVLPTSSERGRRQFSQILRYGAVAAATLAASLLVQIFWWHPHSSVENRPSTTPETSKLPAYVATLTQTADCAWESPGTPRRVGARLARGEELQLQKGIARIRFDSGPELVVEGPSRLRLDSGTAATVAQGKVVFKGDETAAPFDLHTPSSTLVDFGTEYAVAVGPEGEEVHVFDGEVRRTPRTDEGRAETEHLTAGQARRYDGTPEAPGRPVPLDQERFVRQLSHPDQPPDPAAGLLAYEGFDYKDPDLLRTNRANGGFGWAGPWRGFARPLLEGDKNYLALNAKESLVRPRAAVPSVGGSFDYVGFTKYYRPLNTPVRMDADGVYYLSFLFRRQGPPADPLNAVAVLLRTSEEIKQEDNLKRLNVGVGGVNEVFTHLNRVGSRTPLPLKYGETYLLVAKIVASRANPDQVFIRLYASDEPIEREEPGGWSVTGPPFQSDLVFDWLEVHINSKTRQTIDELRLGTTWASVTAPWIGAVKEGKP
jgi:hypothetical protein